MPTNNLIQDAVSEEIKAINRELTPDEKIAMRGEPLDSGFLESDFGDGVTFEPMKFRSTNRGKKKIENDTSSAQDGVVEGHVLSINGSLSDEVNFSPVKCPILQETRKIITFTDENTGKKFTLELNNKGFLCVGSNSDRFIWNNDKTNAEKLNEVLARTYLRKVADGEAPAVTVKFGHKIKESFQIKHLYGLVEEYSKQYKNQQPTYADIAQFCQALSKGGTKPNYIKKLKTMVIDKKLTEISGIGDPIERFAKLTQYKAELGVDEQAVKIYNTLMKPGYLSSSAYVEKLALTPNNLPGLFAEYAQYKEDVEKTSPLVQWEKFREELVKAGADSKEVQKVKVERKLLELSQVKNLTERFESLQAYKDKPKQDQKEEGIYADLMKPGRLYSSDYYNKLALTPQNLSGLAEEYFTNIRTKETRSPNPEELAFFYEKLRKYGAKEEDLKKVKVEMKLREISAGPNDKRIELQKFKNALETDGTSLPHYNKLVQPGLTGRQWDRFAPDWLKPLRSAAQLSEIATSASLLKGNPKEIKLKEITQTNENTDVSNQQSSRPEPRP